MRHVVVGTAGHIDHGKSALVRALTGTDPDRLKEEKARGITVDLGFADAGIAGFRMGFVDVPGHERFVRNMLAGAGGFDVVLLVVAADESVMPQTREHFDICRLLGVTNAVVAITRSDLADPEFIELAGLEARELLSGSGMAGAEIVPVSAKTGDGLDALRAALGRAASSAPARAGDGPLRLPVDRAFTMRGFGTVVTGTLASGEAKIGDDVDLLPRGARARVRGLQVHGEAVSAARAGQRVAMNLHGVERAGAARGDVVGRPGELAVGWMLDARLELLPSAPAPVEDGDRCHLHLGAAAVLARARLLGGAKALAAGAAGLVQFRLEAPVAASRGERFIIRRYSPVETIGGGTVLDALPPRRSPVSLAAHAAVAALEDEDDEAAAVRFLAEAGMAGMTTAALARRLGTTVGAARAVAAALVERGDVAEAPGRSGDGVLLFAGAVGAFEERLEAAIAEFEAANRLRAGMATEHLREQAGAAGEVTDWTLARLSDAGRVVVSGGTVRTAGRRIELTEAERDVRDRFAGLLSEGGYAAPTVGDAAAALGASETTVEAMARVLVDEGRAVATRPGLYFDSGLLDRLKERVRDRGRSDPVMDVGWFKETFGLSRKHAIPLLEWLDRERVTIRVGGARRIRAFEAESASG